MRRLIAVLFVLLGGFAVLPAHAASCPPGQSPFSDVTDAQVFCSEVLWLRNALILSAAEPARPSALRTT